MSQCACLFPIFEVLYSKFMAKASGLLTKIRERLDRRRLFYVCRDVERAIGLDLSIKNYCLITNATPFSQKLSKLYPNIFLIKSKVQLDTRELLRQKKTKSLIKKGDLALVFKNTAQIENICASQGWQLLNPSAVLADTVEEKISQIEWLGELRRYLPGHKIQLCQNIKWRWKKFILQFNRSHSGSGTILIDSKEKLTAIKQKFPRREARVANFIKGPLFTNNNIVWGDKILIGNISYQITGLPPFTDNHFATIGNDWALPRKILNNAQIAQYKKIAQDVGAKLKKDGWKGLFGIDVILDENSGKLYLAEVNARQPASTTYESVLQDKAGQNTKTATIFEAHLGALLKIKPDGYELTEIKNGAQILQRVTEKIDHLKCPKFADGSISTICYKNKKIDSDLLRIQTDKGIMEDHNIFNDLGRIILVGILTAHKQIIRRKTRAGVILIRSGLIGGKKILLMKRNKYGDEYYSVPGGTVEPGERTKETAIREIGEETHLKFVIDNEKKPICLAAPRRGYYFFAKDIAGREELGGPEKERNTANNSYRLEWIDVKKIKDIQLKPEALKIKLMTALKKYEPKI